MTQHRDTREFRAARDLMFRIYGHTCWICGHDDAGEADHLEAISLHPDQPVDYQRMRPAHGSNHPCRHPDCVARKGRPRCCNQERGAKPVAVSMARQARMPW